MIGRAVTLAFVLALAVVGFAIVKHNDDALPGCPKKFPKSSFPNATGCTNIPLSERNEMIDRISWKEGWQKGEVTNRHTGETRVDSIDCGEAKKAAHRTRFKMRDWWLEVNYTSGEADRLAGLHWAIGSWHYVYISEPHRDSYEADIVIHEAWHCANMGQDDHWPAYAAGQLCHK